MKLFLISINPILLTLLFYFFFYLPVLAAAPDSSINFYDTPFLYHFVFLYHITPYVLLFFISRKNLKCSCKTLYIHVPRQAYLFLHTPHRAFFYGSRVLLFFFVCCLCNKHSLPNYLYTL